MTPISGWLAIIVVLLSGGLIHTAEARPEYAVKEKLNCVSCHATPWGGGPRNVFGKTYGSRGLGAGPLTSIDVVYADFRMIAYYPTDKTAERTNGVALMQASVSGNTPIVQNENGAEMRGVLTFNMAPLTGTQVREGYVRWQTATSQGGTPMHFVLGRFYVPFGLLTDEHRTYTRMQTNMTYNNFDVGAAVSGNIGNPFHYDFAVVNDFQTGGMFTNNDLTYGLVLNLRWNPGNLPFFLGASGNYEKLIHQPDPYAGSIYAALSLDRLTENAISGSLLFERVDAQNWNNSAVNTGMVNPNLNQFFIPTTNAAYGLAVSQSASLGYYGQVKYNLFQQLTLFFKYDYLNLDKGSTDDGYTRLGFGIETYLNSNLIINARYEKALGMRADIANSNVLAAQDDIFVMARVWL